MRLVLAVLLFVAAPAAAQQQPERIPLFVVDMHGATVGLPQAEGWVPPDLPTATGTTTTTSTTTTTTASTTTTTKYPGRNWGYAAGATIYPLRFRVVAFGVGASLLSGRGTAETQVVTGTGTAATTSVARVVHTSITSLVPQVSINFGHKFGWSYMSAGLGRSKVTSKADAIGTTAAIVMPEAWNSALNFGGGARWFMKPHLGAGFDARFVKLASRSPTATLPSAKRTQLWNISVGISIQ